MRNGIFFHETIVSTGSWLNKLIIRLPSKAAANQNSSCTDVGYDNDKIHLLHIYLLHRYISP